MPDGFRNPIAGGGGSLILNSLHSNDYQAGSVGWSINKDGTAEFNGVTIRGTVILGNGTTNTIILDNTRDAIFVYDSGGKLVASVSPSGGVDSLGNTYKAGIVSYLSGNVAVYSQLLAGILALTTGDANGQPFNVFAGSGGGPNADQPYSLIQSPTDAGIPTPIASQINMYGRDAAALRNPYMQIGMTGLSADMQILIQGILVYSAPGTNTAEIWHTVGAVGEPAFGANWSSLGAPFANVVFRRTENNKVALAGVANRSAAVAAPSTIFTLPAGYRPNRSVPLIVTAIGSDGAFQANEVLVINSAGNVNLTSWTGTGIVVPVSLEGCEFYLS